MTTPRPSITLNGPKSRLQARHWIDIAPAGTVMALIENKRTTEQNRKLWPMLTDVSTQLTWHGNKMPPADWKLVFMSGLNSELRVIPNYAGDGFIPLGYSSSKLTKGEFSALIEIIYEFGARHGVKWSDPREAVR